MHTDLADTFCSSAMGLVTYAAVGLGGSSSCDTCVHYHFSVCLIGFLVEVKFSHTEDFLDQSFQYQARESKSAEHDSKTFFSTLFSMLL